MFRTSSLKPLSRSSQTSAAKQKLITANLGKYSIATETNYQPYDEQIIDIEMPRPMLWQQPQQCYSNRSNSSSSKAIATAHTQPFTLVISLRALAIGHLHERQLTSKAINHAKRTIMQSGQSRKADNHAKLSVTQSENAVQYSPA